MKTFPKAQELRSLFNQEFRSMFAQQQGECVMISPNYCQAEIKMMERITREFNEELVKAKFLEVWTGKKP